MASSFKKKSNRGRGTYPCGTKISLQNNQLLISTGVPSFDTVIGGGIAVGSVLLLEEDNFGSYAKTLSNCFLAEGVVSGHFLYLATANVEPNEIWKNLPCPLDEAVSQTSDAKDSDMKIAWRYQNMPKVQSSPSSTKFGHFFDFTKTISEERISKVTKFEFNARDYWSEDQAALTESRSLLTPVYRELLKNIQDIIKKHGFCTSAQEAQDRSILRIVLRSLHSPLWNTADHSLPLFLYYLRALLRSSYAVCWVTLPQYWQNQDSGFLSRVERLCDTVIRLESFAGSDKEANPIYKDYHGLFHIARLPRLNSLACHMPESLNLAFKHRRKKFVIEKLHLPPPDISETADHKDIPATSSCGASLGRSKLDF